MKGPDRLEAVRGLPAGQKPSIRNLAERLQIRHHSAVELVDDRMEKRGLFRRERSADDRRSVLLFVTRRGERLLNRLVRHRIGELRHKAPTLTRALSSVPAPENRRRSVPPKYFEQHADDKFVKHYLGKPTER